MSCYVFSQNWKFGFLDMTITLERVKNYMVTSGLAVLQRPNVKLCGIEKSKKLDLQNADWLFGSIC